MGQMTVLQSNLPAHLAGLFSADMNSDLTSGVNIGYPIISYKGKSWHVVKGDDRELVVNDDGDPAASIEVVILKANPNLSKIYYPSGYEEGSTEKPTCYSTDSKAPAADAAQPQAKNCQACPFNQWGSRITENGAKGKACADHRRLAVAPSDDLENVHLLRVPAASLKELVGYAESLKKRGVPYQALKTKIGFDHTVAFPKLTFKPVGWVDEDEANIIREVMESEVVQAITALNAPSLALPAPAEEDEDDILANPPAHVVQQAAPTTRKKAVATPVEVEQVLAEVEAPAEEQAPAPKKGGFGAKKAAAPVEAPAPKAAPVEDKTTVLVSGALAELDSVLSQFDDQ